MKKELKWKFICSFQRFSVLASKIRSECTARYIVVCTLVISINYIIIILKLRLAVRSKTITWKYFVSFCFYFSSPNIPNRPHFVVHIAPISLFPTSNRIIFISHNHYRRIKPAFILFHLISRLQLHIATFQSACDYFQSTFLFS